MNQLTWQVCRRSSEDVIDKMVEGGADEGRVASSTLIEHAPKGPQIRCTGVCRPILEQLWSHVAWGATLCLYHFVSVSVLHAEAVTLHFMAAALMFLVDCHGSSNNCSSMSRACVPSACGNSAAAWVELANTMHVASSSVHSHKVTPQAKHSSVKTKTSFACGVTCDCGRWKMQRALYWQALPMPLQSCHMRWVCKPWTCCCSCWMSHGNRLMSHDNC